MNSIKVKLANVPAKPTAESLFITQFLLRGSSTTASLTSIKSSASDDADWLLSLSAYTASGLRLGSWGCVAKTRKLVAGRFSFF